MKKILLFLILIIIIGGGCYYYFIMNNKTNNTSNIVINKIRKVEFEDVASSIFKDNYFEAYKDMKRMSVEEKIGQMFLVRYDSSMVSTYTNYYPGGYLLFARDFLGKNKDSMKEELSSINSNVPLAFAVDEEGGTVVRVSKYYNFRSSPFLAPRDYYDQGGYDLLESTEKEKAELLLSIGINLNLAPVADIPSNYNDFIYKRSFRDNADNTSIYIKNMIGYAKKAGISSCLKHFPGYGNNTDTHTGSCFDNRSYETFTGNDYLPFEAGIKAGAPMILVSHNVVGCIDGENPGSISLKMHEELRNKLKYTGIIITDDMGMAAISNNYTDGAVRAVNSLNDMIITSDFINDYNQVLDAYNNKLIDEKTIDKAVTRILAWKYNYNIM